MSATTLCCLLFLLWFLQPLPLAATQPPCLIPVRQGSSSGVALSEVVDELKVPTIAVLLLQTRFRSVYSEFLSTINQKLQQSITFDDRQKFLLWVEASQKLGYGTTTLVFGPPQDLIEEVLDRKLDHRLNLFLFYWNSTRLPQDLAMPEPLRVAFLTVPRPNVIRVYYNQASGDGEGTLTLVNWYDGNGMGLLRRPLLPNQGDVYKDLQGRQLSIPVIHSPPWIFVEEGNSTANASLLAANETDALEVLAEDEDEGPYFRVVGGRDYNLIELLAAKLNFRPDYTDLEERVQGAATGSLDNISFTGGIGVLQRREAHLFLGDVAVSLERSQAVEFTFFTLADSGTFVTHIPQRLNEALALIRPFHYTVWPPLLLTVLLSGPILFLLVYLPHRFMPSPQALPPPQDPDQRLFALVYLNEMRYGLRARHLCRPQPPAGRDLAPRTLFGRCLWFSYHLFLKQNCRFPYENNGLRVNLIVAMFWICATYILSDVYSAQLTSQLARPAREAAIDTLHKLELAMRHDGYELYVERQSASLSLLENGTDVFRRLYKLMVLQNGGGPEANASYLIDSVEKGLRLVKEAGSRKVVLGGRETIYFNMRQYGVKHFQMSEKLYTRYSAVAVKAGSPFLESINDVLIRLFESGVLDRMTNDEYDQMFKTTKKSQRDDPGAATKDTTTQTTTEEVVLKKLNLRTLKGAFLVLLMGHGLSVVVFGLEKLEVDSQVVCGRIRRWARQLRVVGRCAVETVWTLVIRKIIRLVMFKYTWE